MSTTTVEPTEIKGLTLEDARPHLNSSQFYALQRIWNFYKGDTNSQPEVWNLSFDLSLTDYGTAWVSMHLKRIDCDEYSPRAVYCNDGGHFHIGKRGAIRVGTIYKITTIKDYIGFVARMVRGSVF